MAIGLDAACNHRSNSVAGYYRVSKARDGMHAPKIYEDEIRRYCDYKQLTLERIYSDIDFSGYRNSPARPALDELVRSRKSYSKIIVPKLSRFGRSLSQLIQLFDEFETDGINLIFLDLNIETTSSQGRLLRNVMSAFAEYESDVKSDYSKANHRRLAEVGRPAGGPPAFGFTRDPINPKNWRPLEREAAIVREMYERYLAGDSLNAIARDLNRRGKLTRSGSRWEGNKIARTIDRPCSAGLRRCGDELVQGTWQPIVDRETWSRALTRRAEGRELTKDRKRPGPSIHLLTGFLVCGACGRTTHRRVWTKKSGGAYVCPRMNHEACNGGGISSTKAEQIVTDAYLERLGHAEVRGHDHEVGTVSSLWESASLTERRELLSLAISRVELVPRIGSATGKGMPRQRQLRICWTDTRGTGEPGVPSVLPLHRPVSKVCETCGYRKPLKDFLKDPRRPDGKGALCNVCRPRTRVREEKASLGPSDLRKAPRRRESWTEWRRNRLLPK